MFGYGEDAPRNRAGLGCPPPVPLASGLLGQIQPLGFGGVQGGLTLGQRFGRLAEFHRLAGEKFGVGEKGVQLGDFGFQFGDQARKVLKALPFGE